MNAWPELLLHVRVLGWIDQHDAVLVEQALVAFHRDDEIAFVLERNPGAAIRQHIGIAGAGGIQCGAHALADRFVPGSLVLLDVDTGRLPEVEFGDVGA